MLDSNIAVTTKIYKTAVYCRLSSDDGNIGDSSSIQTQKLMLEKYCKEQNFCIADFYVDDGYTGLNFNRPAFQRLLVDIEQGRINLVITKDLSRLGRDYIQTGYYTEIFFPDKNIRYIALSDNIDTLRGDNDIAPFRNILNDMYSRDLSKKVKNAKRQRAIQGMFISSQTPFGYKKDPSNSNRLVIDEEPAKIVKQIFELALIGKGSMIIARELSELKIKTPSLYKFENGDNRFVRGKDIERWNYTTVRKILTDVVYIGDMENGKHHIPNYKTKKRMPVPKDKHIIVQNTHEPIICRDDFQRVKELIKTRARQPKHNHENLFKSLVFCECGWRMALVWTFRRKNKELFYKCVQHAHYPDRCKYHNGIKYDIIKKIVEDKIRELFSIFKNDTELLETIKKRMPQINNQVNSAEEKGKIERRLNFLIRATKLVYDDFLNDKINESTYNQLLNDYRSEEKDLNEKFKKLELVTKHNDDYLDNFQKLKEALTEFLGFKELTVEMVHKLIDKIIIEPIKRDQGKEQREIQIHFRFIKHYF